jgi:sortase A
MVRRRSLLVFALLMLGAGFLLLGRRVYMEVKALAAQRLIDRAFAAHLVDGRPHRPWSWADTYPIARLELDRLQVRRSVLAGASGSSLAFGAGHVDGTAWPNSPGNCVLAGHRDRAFAFLETLRPGDLLRLRTPGAVREYVVRGVDIVPRSDIRALQPADTDHLTLVTCYPFRDLLRSSWRYVVTAEAIGPGASNRMTISSSAEARPPQL